MFANILHANDGSDPALRHWNLRWRWQSKIGPSFTWSRSWRSTTRLNSSKEVREEAGVAARRFQKVLQRAREMAEKSGVKLHSHVLTGHPVRDVVGLAADLKADLLVIGATGHSALYERMIGSRADRMVQLAQCPVLVVK
jgi:nucleotide-binding universal stress UspA family protein